MDLFSSKTSLLAYLRTQIKDQRVLAAIARVPRENFIPDKMLSLAYADEPLPIGHNQTISQPLIVAMMTEALNLRGTEKVLEIGTGSGYQCAILADLAREVYTTERILELSQKAESCLVRLGYHNIHFRVDNQKLGWPEESPFDAIIVTAAAPRIPDSLIDQLGNGGRMVIPVGDRDVQELIQLTKIGERVISRKLGGCRFVPLIGEEAF